MAGPDRNLFKVDFGYDPAAPFNWLFVDIALAVETAGSLRGDERRRIMSSARSKAWANYKASYKAVKGNAPQVSWIFFQAIWSQCVLVWADTSPEMRKHAIDSTARRSWTEQAYNETQTFHRKYSWHVQLVGSIISGDTISPPDRFHDAIGFDNFTVAEPGKRKRTALSIGKVVSIVSNRSQEWRMTDSEIKVWAGYVTRIWHD